MFILGVHVLYFALKDRVIFTFAPKYFFMNAFVEELRWRGMIHDIMPGTEDYLNSGMGTAYVGIDPTADSLHIGHLVGVMMLKHFQLAGHKPLALVGGATGMIGDPSGKSEERNLLSEDVLRYNQQCIQKQLLRFLDFESGINKAELVNNYDWMKSFSFLSFLREVGKHLTINYMLAKDSVQKRLETGLSFTEFSYQLVQAYDFLWLYENYQCRLQMGGSDQWGNITSGTELIRRKTGGTAYALTCPLITKADGSKFGKTEEGNVWLDPAKTSPYKFYQFWLNVSDEDATRYIKIFTLLNKEEIEQLIEQHNQAPHLRILQNQLADFLTAWVHSPEQLKVAKNASQVLFGKGTLEMLQSFTSADFDMIFDGVPRFEVSLNNWHSAIPIIDFLSLTTQVFPSKAEVRRSIKEGALWINKQKASEESMIDRSQLLNDRYLLVQKGKKTYYLIVAV